MFEVWRVLSQPRQIGARLHSNLLGAREQGRCAGGNRWDVSRHGMGSMSVRSLGRCSNRPRALHFLAAIFSGGGGGPFWNFYSFLLQKMIADLTAKGILMRSRRRGRVLGPPLMTNRRPKKPLLAGQRLACRSVPCASNEVGARGCAADSFVCVRPAGQRRPST